MGFGIARQPARCGPACIVIGLATALLACGETDPTAADVGSAAGLEILDPADNYYDVVAHGPRLWVVGYRGKVIYSPDAGDSWQQQRPIGDRSLFSIDTVDGQELWAVGELGLVLHSSDAGETWETQDSGIENENLLAVDFVDAERGWAAGEYGVLLRTSDGGRVWERLAFGDAAAAPDSILSDLQFFDAQNGIIVGEFGTFLATSDGGDTWEAPTQRFADEQTYLFGLGFDDSRNGYVAGLGGLVYETHDGGRTWLEHAFDTKVPIFDVVPGGGGSVRIALGDRGLLMRGEAGSAWKSVDLGVFSFLRAAAFSGEGSGILVGGDGIIRQTRDGGATWTHVAAGDDVSE